MKKSINKNFEQIPYLKLCSTPKILILDSLDGKETLTDAKDVFHNTELCFKSKPGVSTKQQRVSIYKQINDGTFVQTFGSLGNDLDKLCLTENQIVNFCRKYGASLYKRGCILVFLYKNEEQFFIARIHVSKYGSQFATTEHFGCNRIVFCPQYLIVP